MCIVLEERAFFSSFFFFFEDTHIFGLTGEESISPEIKPRNPLTYGPKAAYVTASIDMTSACGSHRQHMNGAAVAFRVTNHLHMGVPEFNRCF